MDQPTKTFTVDKIELLKGGKCYVAKIDFRDIFIPASLVREINKVTMFRTEVIVPAWFYKKIF